MSELIIAEKKYPVLTLAGRPDAMLDRHVAEVYGVKTEEVNRAVTNNPEKFPKEFSYRLTKEELAEVQENFLDLGNLKYSPHLPQAFSWEGCNMLATGSAQKVLNLILIQFTVNQVNLKRKNLPTRRWANLAFKPLPFGVIGTLDNDRSFSI
jgi:hypothetical protein